MGPRVGLMFCLTIMIMAGYNLASRSRRIEQRLNILEDRFNAESKFRREDMWNLFERIENMASMFNMSAKEVGCQRNIETSMENVLHSSTSPEISELFTDWRRDLMQLTVAFKDEKKLNAKLRNELPQVVHRIQTAEEAIKSVGRKLDEFKDDLKALSIDLKTVLNEIYVNQIILQERAQEHTEIKDQLLQIEKQVLQIIEQKNQSLEIAELKNELIQLDDTCNLNKAASTLKIETSTFKTEASSTTESSIVHKQLESCQELYVNGHRSSGQYDVYPKGRSDPIRVFCDQETDGGGWTVFQRRKDGSEDFYRNWADYKRGFGDLDGEFWLGNEYLSTLTSPCCSQLRIDLKNSAGEYKYAMYNEFQIKSASENYMLKVGEFSGNVGYDALKNHNGQQFTTKDVDNEQWSGSNCAVNYVGAWWYHTCFQSHLNGRYKDINMHWRGFSDHQLTFTEMKFRRLEQ